MRHPSKYKTRFGLYKACIKAIETLPPVRLGRYKTEAIYYCEQNFPDLLPQLNALLYPPATWNDLKTYHQLCLHI